MSNRDVFDWVAWKAAEVLLKGYACAARDSNTPPNHEVRSHVICEWYVAKDNGIDDAEFAEW